MSASAQTFFDFLTGSEADFMESVMRELKDVAWAKPLIDDINASGGLKGANKAKLLELRFGDALHQAGITPNYEVAGEGLSTLDFGFASKGQEFRVELMRLEETAAVKAATTTTTDEHGTTWVKRILTTDAEDPKQSGEGETLKAVQRICQKFESGGKPHKFPPLDGAVHVLLVDFRTFSNGGDEWDRIHVALGGEMVPSGWYRRYWEGKLISGVFSPRTTVKGAAEARERLHFIGFVNEKEYAPGKFGHSIQFVANPHLFKTAGAARWALKGWPVKPLTILNAPSWWQRVYNRIMRTVLRLRKFVTRNRQPY